MTDGSDQYDMLASLHPMKRLGKPEEWLDLVMWLCSDGASFVTGSAYLSMAATSRSRARLLRFAYDLPHWLTFLMNDTQPPLRGVLQLSVMNAPLDCFWI